jgi:hypothetical protein
LHIGADKGQRPDYPEISSDEPPKPRLRERLRVAIRTRNYSRRTEKTYWYWILSFIRFHGRRS